MKALIKRLVYHFIPPPVASIAGPFTCPVCRKEHVAMYPLSAHYLGHYQLHGFVHNIMQMETLNLQHYACANCFAADRERLYALYFQRFLPTQPGQLKLLDIAPSRPLAAFLKTFPNVVYRSTDLYMEEVDDRSDITDMHIYQESQFDFVICSHVLEHIPDDRKALQEIYRILRPGGKAILMVPLNSGLEHTQEMPNEPIDEAYRWKYFGQDDHVRMYGTKDFVQRIEETGFSVEQLNQDSFPPNSFKQHAIFPTSVLYVAVK